MPPSLCANVVSTVRTFSSSSAESLDEAMNCLIGVGRDVSKILPPFAVHDLATALAAVLLAQAPYAAAKPAPKAVAARAGDLTPAASPESVGFDSARLRKLDAYMAKVVADGRVAGMTTLLARHGKVVEFNTYGKTSLATGQAMPKHEIFRMDSMSKPLTGVAMMILFDQGRYALDDPIGKYLPEFAGGLKDSVTIRELLEHRSGLPADRDLWRLASSPEEARQIVLATPLEYRPGTQYVYSDLGAMTLGFLVEKLSGQPLDQYLAQWVFQPLGMTNTFFRPPDSVKYRAAPTEDTPPRGYPLKGEVHDENAYALGGVAGHAGLFSTAADLSIFAQMILNGGEYNGTRIVSDSTIRLFTHALSRIRGTSTTNLWAVGDERAFHKSTP